MISVLLMRKWKSGSYFSIIDSRTWHHAHVVIQFRRSRDAIPEVEIVTVYVLFSIGRDSFPKQLSSVNHRPAPVLGSWGISRLFAPTPTGVCSDHSEHLVYRRDP